MNISEKITELLGNHVKNRFNPSLRNPILYFHRVLDDKDPFYPGDITSKEFDKLLSCLSKIFTFESIELLREPSSPGKPKIGITFDDGYKDNLTNALPILRKYGAPATVFVATAGIQNGYLWNDLINYAAKNANQSKLEALFGNVVSDEMRVELSNQSNASLKYASPSQRDFFVKSTLEQWGVEEEFCPRVMMTEEELKELSQDPLITIGAHTHDHTILTTLGDIDCSKQIKKNKFILEKIIGKKVNVFAYPNGRRVQDYSSYHKDIIKGAGFTSAFTTMDGGVDSKVDPFEQPRFLPFRKSPSLMALSAMKIAGEEA